MTETTKPDMLHPPCYGVMAINRSGTCPRCGATENDYCGDPIAQDFQESALANGEAEIVSIDR